MTNLRKAWLNGLFVAVVIVLGISLKASHTYYPATINHYFLEDETTKAYSALYRVADKSAESLDALVVLAKSHGNIYWLKKAAALNSLDAQLALVELDNDATDLYWLNEAANSGDAASQFELSLVEPNKQRMLELKKLSADQGFPPAIIAIAKYYYETQQEGLAKSYLIKASEYDSLSQFKLARILWKEGSHELAYNHFSSIVNLQPKAKQYIHAIDNIPRVSLTDLMTINANINSTYIPESCSQNIQFVATSLDSVVQAKAFKTNFENDKRFAKLPICIAPIVWVPRDDFTCKVQSNRQTCDLNSISEQLQEPNFTHLSLFLENGKAYVNNGVMYLDTADTYSVFVHELAHFVGFVDEYPVSKELASQYCLNPNLTVPNLLIANDDEDVTKNNTYKIWQQFIKSINDDSFRKAERDGAYIDDLHSISLAKTNTCSNLSIKAFKPTSRMTFMEFHDVNYIPALYIAMWQDLLSKDHQSIAVARYFLDQATTKKAKEYWGSYY